MEQPIFILSPHSNLEYFHELIKRGPKSINWLKGGLKLQLSLKEKLISTSILVYRNTFFFLLKQGILIFPLFL